MAKIMKGKNKPPPVHVGGFCFFGEVNYGKSNQNIHG